jgi:PST family polysaccharide transporter
MRRGTTRASVKVIAKRKISAAGFEKLWQLAVGLLTLKILSDYLGVEDFGIYQTASAILVIATAATWLCPAEALASRFDGDGRLSPKLFQTIFLLRVGISLVIYLAIAVLAPAVYGLDLRRYVLILLLCFSIVHAEPAGLLRFYLEADGLLGRLAVIRLTTSALRLVGMLVCVKLQAPVPAVISLLAAEQIVNSLAYYRLYSNFFTRFSFKTISFDRKAAMSVLKSGSKYWLGFVMMYCYLKFDRLFFSAHMPKADFGIYAAGANMAEQVNSLGIMLVAVLAPSSIYTKTKEESIRSITSFVLLVFGIGLTAAVFSYCLAPTIIHYIFGTKYTQSLAVFQALVLLAPLAYLDAASSVLIFKFEKAKLFIGKALVSLLITTAAITYLLPVLGWHAAMAASATALVANLAINYRLYRKIRLEFQ